MSREPVDEVADLYQQAAAPLIGLLTAIGGSREDAEEITHEAFVRLLERWPKIRRYDDPVTWVRTVAVRILISRRRRARVAKLALRRQHVREEFRHHDAFPTLVGVEHALRRLTVEQRAAVLLHYVYDLPISAVADELGVAPGTV